MWRVTVIAVLFSGCTLANDIDVCQRDRAPERQLNQARTEGDQSPTGTQAVAPMPAGGALVVFRTALGSDPEDERSEIAGVVVDAEGNALSTCMSPNEHVYVPATAARGEVERQAEASIAPPTDASESAVGALAWAEDRGDTISMRALGLNVSGCPVGTISDEAPRVLELAMDAPGCAAITDPNAPSTCYVDTSIARLGPSRFAATWIRSAGVAGGASADVYAVVFDVGFLGLTLRPTPRSPTGAAAPLLGDGQPIAASTLALDDGRFLVAWQLRGLGRLATLAQVFGEDLEPVGAVQLLDDVAATELPARGVLRVAAARQGDSVLVVFTRPDADDAPRVHGLLLSDDGTPRAGPNGREPFRLSDGDGASEETEPTVTPFEGGFAVAWTSRGASDTDATIRAAFLDVDGQRRFANPSCDRVPFLLSRGSTGAQTNAGLATLRGGALVAVFSDDGVNGSDMSGRSVTSVVEAPRTLLPLR